jgi:hypothetical protein
VEIILSDLECNNFRLYPQFPHIIPSMEHSYTSSHDFIEYAYARNRNKNVYSVKAESAMPPEADSHYHLAVLSVTNNTAFSITTE